MVICLMYSLSLFSVWVIFFLFVFFCRYRLSGVIFCLMYMCLMMSLDLVNFKFDVYVFLSLLINLGLILFSGNLKFIYL